jgi:hypothetical protein
MINDGINDVPENTIALFYSNLHGNFDKSKSQEVISKPTKQRHWFTPHFYNCLPLTIGNQYGFIITSQFDIEFEWDGTDGADSIKFNFPNKTIEELENFYPRVESHFGHGVISIIVPFAIRTPPGINVMTINPPNYVIPNITVLTGIVETDNLRRDFIFNIKIQIPNLKVSIPAGYPIAAFIPIPRYFVDKFEIADAEDIFTEDVFLNELNAEFDAGLKREIIDPELPKKIGRDYFRGQDVYGNKFSDHQKP